MTSAATIARLDVLPEIQLERLHVGIRRSRARVVRHRRRGGHGIHGRRSAATRARGQNRGEGERRTELYGAQEGFHCILPDHRSSPYSHRAATSANTFFNLYPLALKMPLIWPTALRSASLSVGERKQTAFQTFSTWHWAN